MGRSRRCVVQFSMGLMIMVMLVVVLLGLSGRFGGSVAAILALWLVCVADADGDPHVQRTARLQAFGIDGLIPWGLFVMRIPPLTTFLPMTIWLVALGGVCGTVAVVTRRWLERSGGE